ncbi:phage tail tape measure protein [Piscibacillus salipiscarius]|uniref:phage tail tape measure protein n=1 Tax=Piscibacillus salipiscarius TaxID=299480 RepID=UPI0006D084C7|nr:phage tail tape measure protein [Piscibacillus salipiscarius]
MAKQPETKVTFSVFNKEFNEAMNEMKGESKQLRKEFKLQSEQMKDTASETQKLESRIEYLGKQQSIAKRQIQETEKQLEKAKKVYGENSNEANKLSNRLLDLRISEQKLQNSINRTETELNQQAQDMADARKEAGKFRQSLDKTAEAANNVGDSLSTGLTLPLAGVGVAAGATAMNVQDSIRLMNDLVGEAGDEAKQLEEDFRAVWDDGFGNSPEHVARSIALIKQNIQGINNGSELQKVTKDMLALAEVTEVDMSEATRGVNQLMHNFGITATEALDLFVKGQQEGLNYSNEMFDNIAEYAPLFQGMKFFGRGILCDSSQWYPKRSI